MLKTVSLWTFVVFTLCVVHQSASAQDGDGVGAFSRTGLDGWSEKSFEGHTRYTLAQSEHGQVLKADSTAAASGLYFETSADLNRTPCLTWSWKVANVLDGLDETTKAGDDYPARVYVVFSTGPFFWNTRALNYVWSANKPRYAVWPNAFTANAAQIAAESGTEHVGRWRRQSHNVLNDYERAFGGADGATVQAVALMTDTDNSGRSASAYYGDIRFTTHCEQSGS